MRQRLSYANVMATVAVFIALGGSSYAAVKITGKDVKDGTLTGVDVKSSSLAGSDIRSGAVASADIANGSLLTEDFKSGQLPAGAPGPKGDRGATGPEGPKGDPGAPGADGTDATINGVAAGGALGGTYPNPSIADDAVTAAKLGSDVQPAVMFNATPRAAFIAGDSLLVAGTRLHFLCTAFRIQVRFQNLTGTQGTIMASYLRTGPTPTLVHLTDDNGGDGVVWLDTQDNVGGNGNEAGTGTFVWTNGASVVSGEFRYFTDANHCEFYGTIHAGT
jgi:hypothetical protein